jgi:hypothetical protein
MVESDRALDLHHAVELFLAHTEKHRSQAVHRRYSTAMELFLTFLAVELLDPEEPPQKNDSGPAGRLNELSPEILRRYTDSFLLDRLSGDRRRLKRHLTALRAFLQFAAQQHLLEPKKEQRLNEVVVSAITTLRQSTDLALEPEPEDEAQLFRVLRKSAAQMKVENLLTGEVIEDLHLRNHAECPLGQNDICLLRVSAQGAGRAADCLGVMDSPWVPDTPPGDVIHFGTDVEEFTAELDEDLDEEDFEDLELTPEEALEMLFLEDRWAPRNLIEIILDGYDEVRDELLEWLYDENARNDPFPGGGEAPANAARILSEMGETDIAGRLIEVLGDSDGLGEEAPLALARIGPPVLSLLISVLDEKTERETRVAGALWTLGYMAVLHPAIRPRVIARLGRHVIEGKTAVQTALQVLIEARGVEATAAIENASKTGNLDLEKHGYTLELLVDGVQAPHIGQTLREVLLPLVFLYPTEDDLDDLYATIDEELGDWESIDDPFDDPDTDPSTLENEESLDDLDADLDEWLEKETPPREQKGPSKKEDENQDNVIPFPPNSRDPLSQ